MSTFSEQQIFQTVSRQMSGEGAVTFRSLVKETGVSIGSLYHRFDSREGLLAETWADALTSFQRRFLAALEADDEDAGVNAALATPRFCRAEPERAALLACCRASEFLSEATPSAIRDSINDGNDEVQRAVRRYASRVGLSLQACRMGLMAFPLGAVRAYLPDRAVPRSVDRYVAAAFKAIEADELTPDST
ncbi:MAG: TetR/AcrR family transcriptional regulator, partial [Pseudomonadota bacterium]